VDDFRKAGYLPEVICNFIALLGWNPGTLRSADGKQIEKFDMDFLARHFDVRDIGKSNARFDRGKLAAFNQDALAGKTDPPLTDEQFARRWLDWCALHAPLVIQKFGAPGAAAARLAALVKAVRPRAKTFRDAVDVARFALTDDNALAFDPAALSKCLTPAGADVLRQFLDRSALDSLVPWSADAVHRAIEEFAARLAPPGVATLAQPLRVALTGTSVSPPIELTIAALGPTSVRVRVERCLALL
jgi:glutamyl-tRNA synthetase